MDSLCEAFEKLTIDGKFTCFPKLPKAIQLMIWKEAIADPIVYDVMWVCSYMRQPMVPEMLSGINWLSHHEATKVHKLFLCNSLSGVRFHFDLQYDSILLRTPDEWDFLGKMIIGETVTSIQSSARICDPRPPLVDIDRYLELVMDAIHSLPFPHYLFFPHRNLRTFIVQDLQCSRKHRLQISDTCQ